MKSCENCNNEFMGMYGSGRFCSQECARSFSTREKRKEINLKVSKAAKAGWNAKKEDWINQFDSLAKISNVDLRRKILNELGVGCSRCGWKEASGDFHHIRGKKINDPDSQTNVSYLCPNCHRLFHLKKITERDILSLEQQIGDRWKQAYLNMHR